jgi:transposase
MSADRHYPTDVTDAQWDLLQSLLPERAWHPGGRGRPPSCDVRRILNGILYLNKTGCQWRMIPQEFGNWSTIYGYCKRWRRAAVWARLMETLRQWERRVCGTIARALRWQYGFAEHHDSDATRRHRL